jgi:hypothetical protein
MPEDKETPPNAAETPPETPPEQTAQTLTDDQAATAALRELIAEQKKANDALMEQVNELKKSNARLALMSSAPVPTDSDLFSGFSRYKK